MNCKPGDLAVIVSVGFCKPPALRSILMDKAIGRVVRVVCLQPATDGSGDCWRIEEPFSIWWQGSPIELFGVADANLRPLRDSAGEDETLTWAGSPLELTPAWVHPADRLGTITREQWDNYVSTFDKRHK